MDRTAIKFVIVGIINTLFGTAIMFGLYNLAGYNYWFSSAANYFFGSILSFILNKRFTFQNQDPVRKTAPKFILNILVCYLLAYGIAKQLALWIFSGFTQQVAENAAMLLGLVLFMGMNYVGQRFFAFR